MADDKEPDLTSAAGLHAQPEYSNPQVPAFGSPPATPVAAGAKRMSAGEMRPGDPAVRRATADRAGNSGGAPAGAPVEVPADNQEAELARLFAAHHAQVLRAAFRLLGEAADAEDVLQTVFLRLARGLERYRLGPEPAAYLHRMAVNASLDLLRQRPRQTAALRGDGERLDPDHLPHPAPDPERRRGQHDLRAALRAAIAALPPRAAEIFCLRHIEGRDNTSIARQLGLSRVTVGVILHRARRQLRTALAEVREQG